MAVQLVTPYRVSHLQRYGFTLRGNVTSAYPPLHALLILVVYVAEFRSGSRTFSVITAHGLYKHV